MPFKNKDASLVTAVRPRGAALRGHMSLPPAKADPYSTRTQKQFDALLLIFIAGIIFIGFRGALKDRAHRAAIVTPETQKTQVAAK